MPNTCQQKRVARWYKGKVKQREPSPLLRCIHKSHFYTRSPIMIGFQLSLSLSFF